MKNVLKLLSTTVIVITLSGCGTAAETSKNEDKSSGNGNESTGIVAGSLAPSLTEEDRSYHYVFELKNDKTEDVVLSMNSSQYFDYHLFNKEGTVVYTYSDDKMFTQMLQEKILKPGETLEMEVDATEGLLTLPEGTYTLEVWSTANESEEWKVSTEVIWDGKSEVTGGKLKVLEASVIFEGLQDTNSIEVTNEQNEPEAMRLTEVSQPFFNNLEIGTKIRVFYVEIDGQKIIQAANME
ncbi:MAG: BsuPI-related putative proteinase inhibitor [Paenisporosarcina sp.]